MRRSSHEVVAGEHRDARGLVEMYWPLVVLGLLAIGVALVAHHMLFPAYSWNRDEPVYIWQMHNLRNGHIRSTDGGAPIFFRPWLSAAEDGVVFSHFPVGWPLVLLAGDVIFGSPDAGLAFAALLAVLGTYALARELTKDHTLALVAAAVMVCSPILAVQGGIYLGYIFTLGLGLLFAASLLSGVRRALPGRLAIAGALLGWILLTRPFDAVLWALAVGGYIAFVRRHEWRALLRAARWFVVGLLPLLVATLVYNRLSTGSFTQFPNTAADPLDKFGFGVRRIMPRFGKFYYGKRQAVGGTAKNAFWTPMFLAGSYLGALVALGGLWLRRRDRTTIALLAIAAVFPVGYFFFWGTSISSLTAKLSGPIYFVPLYAPLSILIATSVLFMWRRRRSLGILLVAALILATIPAAANRFDVNRQLSQIQIPWKHGSDSIKGRALVFVAGTDQYLLFLDPFAANNADINGPVIYAANRGAGNLELIDAMPDRTPYVQQSSIDPGDLGPQTFPHTPKISTTPLHVIRGKGLSLHARITNTSDSKTVGTYVKIGRYVQWQILSTNSKRGDTYDYDFRVGIPDQAGSSAPSIITLLRRQAYVTVGVGFGPTRNFVVNNPQAKQIFQYRVHNDSLEVLLPSVKALSIKKKQKKDRRRWHQTQSLPSLDVTPAATTGVRRLP